MRAMTLPGDHAHAVRSLLADEPARPDDGAAAVGHLQRLCRAARRDLPASGVGVSILSETGHLMTAAASSSTSAMIEELQFALGEGPCLAAFESRSPVLVPDLGEAATTTTWPVYAPAARSHGVQAVFAFPLQVGVARLGALDVYRDQPGTLSLWTLSRALTYAEVAVQTMLDAQQDGEAAILLGDAEETRFEVYQAQGMVMVQLGVAADEALARIRAHAFVQDRRLVDVAEDIIARRLSLEPDGPGP